MKPWSESFRLILAVALTVLPGLAGNTALAQPPKSGGTLNLVLNYEPPTLVALTTVATPALSVSAKVTEGLLKYDYDLTPRPQLATEWSISPDGKEYTFKLRKGVKWHDGKDFGSDDVAYSILTLKKFHPRGANTFANVSEVRTPDAHTAVIVLSKPAPYLIRAFTAAESPILPKHIYENTDPLTNPNGNAPIGTGPYRFKEWVRGSHVVYERNPDYWDSPKPYIDRLIVRFIHDSGARSLAFETGEADLGYRTPIAWSDLERFSKLPNVAFETKGNSYSFNVESLQFNLDDEHFKNDKVRQAIAHALDRKVAVGIAYYGYGQISHSPIAPGLTAYHDPSPSPYPFDLEKANQRLDEAGYPRGKDGLRFKATLDYNPLSDDLKRLAEYTRSALAKIGIGVTIRSQDQPTFVKRVYTDRDFEFTINGHSNLFDPTVGVQRLYWSKNFFKGRPFSNASHYVNPDVDKLLEDAQTEIDPAKRVALFRKFQQIVAVDVPDINLVSPQYITIYNKRVHDHSLTADGVESNLADVWLDK
jgi:peptide/nickel transport system substrate-binding protein